jgi:hypothetical protein
MNLDQFSAITGIPIVHVDQCKHEFKQYNGGDSLFMACTKCDIQYDTQTNKAEE